MADATAIEWADSTFNPWMGCTKVSPACDDCYAERDTRRFGRVQWGAGQPRVRTGVDNWRRPVRWNDKPIIECMGCGWRGESRAAGVRMNPPGFHPPVLSARICPTCEQPLLKEARRRVFCASLADWLDNEVPIEWFVDLLDMIRRTPNLDWMLLSKRIGNWRGRIERAYQWCEARVNLAGGETFEKAKALALWLDAWLCGECPPNVWIGATVVNQDEADRDIPKLLRVPARIRFVSIEPMLGCIDLNALPDLCGDPSWDSSALHGVRECVFGAVVSRESIPKLHWVICGGESGPHARPMHPDWVRSLRDQCTGAGVPFLFKQWGEWAPVSDVHESVIDAVYRSNRPARRGEDQGALDDSYGRRCMVPIFSMWANGCLHGTTTPGAYLQGMGAMTVYSVGKAAAGRTIDGKTWTQFPESAA